MPMKEVKDLNKWRDIPCSWIGILNRVMMSISPRLVYKFNAFSIKIAVGFFIDISKLILKFIWKSIGPRIVKTILEKKIKWEGPLCSILRLTMQL